MDEAAACERGQEGRSDGLVKTYKTFKGSKRVLREVGR